METVIPALLTWATAQGPAWVLLLGALAGWWQHARDARAREDALNDKLLTTAVDGQKQTYEAISTIREALIHLNRGRP